MPETEAYGPFDPDLAWQLRQRLDAWCKTPDPFIAIGPCDVCEAIMPALDAMLDLYAGAMRREPLEVSPS